MKTAVFYYTQSGQALAAAQSICQPLQGDGMTVVYKQIVPEQPFPFPWSKDEFFNVFPETRLGLPPYGIQPIDLEDVQDADLVMVVGQSWYLSPSLPIQSFFTDERIKQYLGGKQVVFVNACRNMWLKTSHAIKGYLRDAGATFVGHIVLQDNNAPNLVSVITIIRWLIYGKKEPTRLLPQAGINDKEIAEASQFGQIIRDTCRDGAVDGLQDRLLAAGAIKYKPSVLFVEKIGHRMFGFWAKFVRKKGGFGDPRRRGRLNAFCIYLFSALFAISPFGVLVFWLTYPFRHIPRHRQEDCSVK